MKLALADRLACPLCLGPLTLHADEREGDAIRSGSFACPACERTFPIREGVPRFLVAGETAMTTGDRFDAQWKLRSAGRFEPNGLLYSHDCEELVKFWFERPFGSPAAGEWMLDAGCGTGEKALAVARQHPELQVVALDIGSTVAAVANEPDRPPNVHFVQGDVMNLPFAPRSFDKVVSWGVLHATPDTGAAFRAVSRFVAPGGRMLVWIYPHGSEDALLGRFYRIRDRHFFGVAHRLPPRLLLPLVYAYCFLVGPSYLLDYHRSMLPKYKDCSYVSLEGRTVMERFRSMVFIVYDTLLPRYQHRHRRSEVLDWFAREGMTDAATDGDGHYWGRSAPAGP